ncbi:MAG: hypothetical protein AAGF84_10810 [Planctomycetota bacterium]
MVAKHTNLTMMVVPFEKEAITLEEVRKRLSKALGREVPNDTPEDVLRQRYHALPADIQRRLAAKEDVRKVPDAPKPTAKPPATDDNKKPAASTDG